MDAQASLPYLKFAPVEMNIETNFFAPLLVALQDLVKYFLEYNIFCCQEAFREKLSPFILRLFFLGIPLFFYNWYAFYIKIEK